MFYVLTVALVLIAAIEGICWKANRQSPLDTIFGISVIGVFFALAIFGLSFSWEDAPFANLTWTTVGWTALINVLVIIRVMAWVKILKYVFLSVADPLSLLWLVFLTFFSWLIFGGSLGGWEIGAVALILVSGMALGFGQRSERGHRNYKLGLAFLVLWLVAAVTNELLAKQITIEGLAPATYSALRFLIIVPMCLVLYLVLRRNPIKTLKSVCRDKIIIAISFLFAVGTVVYMTLLVGMNVGVLHSILTAATPLVVLMSIFIFKERLRWYNYIFIALILVGAVGLALLSG